MDRVKRLRIFAGPNGSGKTTLCNYFVKTNVFKDYYFINADIINTDLNTFLNFGYFPIKFSEADLRSLDNLYEAMKLADKVFFFNNSEQEQIREYSVFAEKKNNALHISPKTIIPWWFNEYVLGRI